MKIVVAAAALAAFVASPWALPSTASAQTPAAKQTAGKKKATVTPKPKAQAYSPYSSNPEYDVYVNGEYVGSDPDPRIRSTIRREAIGNQDLKDDR